jgi:hypothetical protein
MRPRNQSELQDRNGVSGIEKCTPRTYGEYGISASKIRPGDFRKSEEFLALELRFRNENCWTKTQATVCGGLDLIACLDNYSCRKPRSRL